MKNPFSNTSGNRSHKVCLVLFFIVMMSWTESARTQLDKDCPPLSTLIEQEQPINIAPGANYAIDDPEESENGLIFTKSCADFIPIFGSEKSVLWLQFTVHNGTQQISDWAIRLESVTIENARLFEEDSSGNLTLIHEYQTGEERSVVSIKPALALKIDPDTTKTFRLSVADPVQANLVASITPDKALAANTLSEIFQIVIATGFFFGLFFVTLFWRRHSRNMATVYYCAYLCFIAFGNLFYHDIPSLIGVSLGGADINFIIRNSMETLASFAMMSFTYELLSLKIQAPRLAKVFKTLSLTPQAILLVLVWILPSNSFSQIFSDTIGFLSLSCFLLCLYFAFKRQPTAQILTVSFIVLMVGIIVSELVTDPAHAFAWSDTPIATYQLLDIWVYQVTLMIESCLIFLACNQYSKERQALADAQIQELQTLNTSYEKKLAAALARNKFPDQMQASVPSAQDRFLADAVNFIHSHIAEESFGVVALADALAVSERTLRRKIKSATNLSPINFIQQQRILVAHDLMQQNAYATVSEVAYAVGFSSPSHFSKIYKDTYNVVPAETLKASG
ncbi:helix-turn-helix domain-containing protein [Kordiimonas aquimaris]|uniref:helix-turn-helix domain-containing protein n=1 Tax=Kordiimonas aquimaris TaxID=707591 RepID=UPI0021CF3601|nr:helix-turn-helix domain-containing protein [Kordiimonas aquimaris]